MRAASMTTPHIRNTPAPRKESSKEQLTMFNGQIKWNTLNS